MPRCFPALLVLAAALCAGALPTAAKDPDPKAEASKLLKQFFATPQEDKRQELIAKAAALPAMPWAEFKPIYEEWKKLALRPAKGPGGTRTLTFGELNFKFDITGGGKAPSPALIYLHGSGGPDGMGKSFWAKGGFVQSCPEAPPIKADGEREWTNGWSDDFFFELLRTLRRENVTDCNRLYLAGFSAGGFGTWYYASRFPDLFAAVFPMAGGPWIPDEPEYPVESNLANLRLLPISIWHGALDKNVPVGPERKAVATLKKLGYEHFYKEYPDGDHGNWFQADSGTIKKECFGWLDKKVRNPHPKEVTYVAQLVISKVNKPIPGGAFWAHMVTPGIDSREYKSNNWKAKITGKILEGNQVEVTTTSSVREAWVYLCQELVDLNASVAVKWNGQTAFEGVPQCRLDTLLATFDRAWDRDLSYPVRIDLAKK